MIKCAHKRTNKKKKEIALMKKNSYTEVANLDGELGEFSLQD